MSVHRFAGLWCAVVLGSCVPAGCVAPPSESGAPTSNSATTSRDGAGVAPPEGPDPGKGPQIDMAGDQPGIENPPEGAKAIVFTTLVDLPMDVSLEPAWSVVDAGVFPAITRGVWNSNGLRIGLLPKDKLAAFLEALPPNWGNRRRQMWGGDEPTVLVRSRPIRAQFFADLTVPPFAPQRETFTGHTVAMLMELRPQRGGFTLVTLTPQHHQPRQLIRPRKPQEKLLDGRIFEELSVRVAVPEEGEAARYLVMGLARSPRTLPVDQRDLPLRGQEAEPGPDGRPSAPADEQSVASGEALDLVLQAEQGLPEGEQPEQPEGPPPLGGIRDERVEPLPLNLGRALMTTGMRGGEAQVLIIMEIRGIRE